jgi:hypothetical protein
MLSLARFYPSARARWQRWQRFRIRGCEPEPSNGIEWNWKESDDQSRFGWAFRERDCGVEDEPETRIAAGANEP